MHISLYLMSTLGDETEILPGFGSHLAMYEGVQGVEFRVM